MERWKQLFENLGYKIEKDNANMLVLCKDDDNVILFDKECGKFRMMPRETSVIQLPR